jgi:hypothetical protein
MGFGGITMKKGTLKILYMNIKAIIALVALYIFKRCISFNDDSFFLKLSIYSIGVLLLFGVNHYLFMKILFGKDDAKS